MIHFHLQINSITFLQFIQSHHDFIMISKAIVR